MRVHWLQHAEHENLGCIAPWLASRGHTVRCSRLQHGELPPRVGEFDWLIVMGGPMNIYEHAAYPWLVAEKQAIRAALNAGQRLLGICLGAQLIADQLGGPVVKNPELEVGWHPVSLTAAGRSNETFKGFPEQFTAFHWHGDTFALPQDSQPLMQSEACANQAFTQGTTVAGIQFHLEVTAADARRWFASEQPKPSRHVQASQAILAALPNFAENNRLMLKILENLEAAG